MVSHTVVIDGRLDVRGHLIEIVFADPPTKYSTTHKHIDPINPISRLLGV